MKETVIVQESTVADRLTAIAAGEIVPAEIHPELQEEDLVLDVQDFSLWYSDKQALFSSYLPVSRGKVTALIGPSGCGKSTLLRSVNRMNDLIDNVTYALQINGERNRTVLAEVCEKALRGAALWDEVRDRLDDNALGMAGGQQQRLCIAWAIAAEPEMLLMDEPCSALDPLATTRVEELILRLRGDYTVLIVAHNMQQASPVR